MSIRIIKGNKELNLILDKKTNRYKISTKDLEDLRILDILYEKELSDNIELINNDFKNKPTEIVQKWLEVSLGILATFLGVSAHFKNDAEVIKCLREDKGIEDCFKILKEYYQMQISICLPLRNTLVVYESVKRHRCGR